MTYVTGVLFRIFHECFVTPEGVNHESAEETTKDIEQQNRYVPSIRIQASPGRQCRIGARAIQAAHRGEI
jgi:hypothetical protein